MRRGNWICVSQGFPAVPFLVDTDLTRADGLISCRELTTTEMIRAGYRAIRLLRLLTELPFVP